MLLTSWAIIVATLVAITAAAPIRGDDCILNAARALITFRYCNIDIPTELDEISFESRDGEALDVSAIHSASLHWSMLPLPVIEPAHQHSDMTWQNCPASSHMLVSKIKPCMSKYKLVCTV